MRTGDEDREAGHPVSPARDRIAYHERFTFRGSSGPPRCVVNTRPVSRHAGPAASWAAFCRIRYARSAASVGGGTGTTRRERADFGSTKTKCPPTRCRAWRTVRVASPKSMSLQRRPSSSPFRRPRVRAQTHSASNRSPRMTPTSRRASSTLSTRTSLQIPHGQVEDFEGGLFGGELAAVAGHLPQPGVHRLDQVGGRYEDLRRRRFRLLFRFRAG